MLNDSKIMHSYNNSTKLFLVVGNLYKILLDTLYKLFILSIIYYEFLASL